MKITNMINAGTPNDLILINIVVQFSTILL